MRLKPSLLAFAACLALAGCTPYTTTGYNPLMTDIESLQHAGPANVTVGSFTGPAEPAMQCRLLNGPITLPGHITPQDYIARSLASELQLAGLSGGTGPAVTLTGSLTTFTFSSNLGLGNWQLAETITSSNGKSLSVMAYYEFYTSLVGDAACREVATAFAPAVQQLNQRLISNSGFPALLKN